jgi:hypothetical protein
MKRLILSASLATLIAAAFAPMALATRQVSTPQNLSEGSGLTDLVRHNRDARSKS